jgi:anhydro-N-acetylmuramic acid kinase
MFKENYNVIGVMSGTSLDGVDLAYINFNISEQWTFKILHSETVSYSDEWQHKLKNAIQFTPSELEQLNSDYTKLLASIISEFISKHQLKEIDAVCSHGHTILHQPQNGLTLQIGNLPLLRDLLPYTVVCDFRVQDVALGGQGAPLVPIGDALLFANFDYCLNLGGFSNISFDDHGIRKAFDISPVNTVLNYYANTLGLPYDDGGRMAKTGAIHAELLDKLNGLPYYKAAFPKSLGMEFVRDTIFPILQTYTIPTIDILCTFVEHIAIQIAAFCSPNTKLLVTGGGAFHTYLLDRLQHHVPSVQITIPDDKIIQFKEALIFALLGVLRLRNEINVLASVTGAHHDHSSGQIYS